MLDSLLEELVGETDARGILMNQSDGFHVVPQDGQLVDSRCVKLLRHLQQVDKEMVNVQECGNPRYAASMA